VKTIEKLNMLAEIRDELEKLSEQESEALKLVYTPEIAAALEEITAEFAPLRSAANEKIAVLEKEIKDEVLAAGETIKGARLMAVWSKGRTSWDTKKLEGLAMAIPQVLEAKTEGDPSVSIRKA
jgi:hypothetical protein